MDKYHHIVIDMTNFFWRAFLGSVKRCVTSDENNIASVTITCALASLRKLKNTWGYIDSDIYLLFDNPENVLNIRKVLDDTYKSTRFKKSVPKGIYEALSLFIEILKNYSSHYFIVRVPSLEADDLTYPTIKMIREKSKDKILLISNDLDWARNLDEQVEWWDYKTLYDVEVFKRKFGFSPVGKSVQMYKAIHGDTSDNIKNAVPYLPKEILLDILNRYDSLDTLFNSLYKDNNYAPQWKTKLRECENDIRKNFTLTDFILLDIFIPDYIIAGCRNVKILKLHFNSLDIPLEKDMINKDRASFFQQKKAVTTIIYK